jgi:hypothetical protein
VSWRLLSICGERKSISSVSSRSQIHGFQPDGAATAAEPQQRSPYWSCEVGLALSMELATQLLKTGIQGLIFPGVVEGGDDNLAVYFANCSPISLQIHNEKELLEEAKKMAKKRT